MNATEIRLKTPTNSRPSAIVVNSPAASVIKMQKMMRIERTANQSESVTARNMAMPMMSARSASEPEFLVRQRDLPGEAHPHAVIGRQVQALGFGADEVGGGAGRRQHVEVEHRLHQEEAAGVAGRGRPVRQQALPGQPGRRDLRRRAGEHGVDGGGDLAERPGEILPPAPGRPGWRQGRAGWSRPRRAASGRRRAGRAGPAGGSGRRWRAPARACGISTRPKRSKNGP